MEHASAKLDRLSDLPDCLLLRIISLASLGARTLVKISLLSRRWRHLWSEVPHLEIDPREFQLRKRDGRDPVKEWDKFEKFTDNLLSRHRPDLPLDTLRLYVAHPPQVRGRRELQDQRDAGTWVRLCLARCRPVELDVRNYLHRTRVNLRYLDGGTDFTRLTNLRFSRVVLRDGLARHIGTSGSPRLEHLELDDCDLGFTELLLSRTIKTLVVSSKERRIRDVTPPDPPRIEAPGLASLRMDLDSCDAIVSVRAPSLVEATVRANRISFPNELDMLCNLGNATKLELSRLTSIDLVMIKAEVFPKFHNLTKLLLDQCVCTTFNLFTHTAPNLEELSVRSCKFLGLQPIFDVPTRNPYGGHGDLQMFYNLRILHLDKCNLTWGYTPMVEYFLKKAPNLEKLTLQYCELPGEIPGRSSKSKKMLHQCVNLKSAEIRYVKHDSVSQMVDLLLSISKGLQRTSIVLLSEA